LGVHDADRKYALPQLLKAVLARGVLLVSIITAAFGGVTAVATAKAPKGGTFRLSGQLKGELTLDTAETCVAGNISKNGGYWDIRLYLTDHGIKPTSGTWFLLFGTNTSTIKLPTANADDSAALGVDKGVKPVDEWMSGVHGSSKGTVSFSPGHNSGKIDVTLPPGFNQKGATKPEKIVGTWSC
jgi:hypothetical protein